MATRTKKYKASNYRISKVIWGVRHAPIQNGAETTFSAAPDEPLNLIILKAIYTYAVRLWDKRAGRFPWPLRSIGYKPIMPGHWCVWLGERGDIPSYLRMMEVYVKKTEWSE